MASSNQKAILNIFREIDSICESNGLRYFAIGGTAIGAVRHQGFVPWDDDLDIAMPIEDYGRFLAIASKELPEHMELFTYKDSAHNYCIFAKVMDSRTTQIERAIFSYPDRYTGVWVDIMPMSGVPSGQMAMNAFCRKVKWLDRLNAKVRMPISHWSGTKAKLLALVIKPWRALLGESWFADKWTNLLKAHPFDGAEYVGYTWDISLSRLVFPRIWFESCLTVPFEDATIRIPEGYDNYLRQQFGDYMQLPEEQDRITHDCYVDLDHSYLEYKVGRMKLPSVAAMDNER